MTDADFRFCPRCTAALAQIAALEDSGETVRLRCPACGWTHWNNPTPVLAAVVEYRGQILLARNAAWANPEMYALITGFMEADESPEDGIAREVREETALVASSVDLLGVWDFQKRNQVLICYHVVADGTVRLSPELVDYRLHDPADLYCWPAGTGHALATWLRSRGIEPRYRDWPPIVPAAPSA
ncbi:NUDIX hydrolase [Xylophilus sp. GOD-11R]|uniref:NUDIX hydrolase n=1 Tax=Xylophilus sp. GOD-11R TaxID=3089814 RepID=UPI00298D0D8D|nr:NUDIX hydrolase [Xylophilus sp. GOD-11R]WPB58049.1 NUDIX hydrolase [Xylophilus sp. GOD-11R]